MYNFEMINYDELQDILDFSIYVIEFFRNEQLMIRDFLCEKSPWDSAVCFQLKINIEELNYKKMEMLRSIINRYSEYIKAIYYDSQINDDDLTLSEIDSHIIDYINSHPNLLMIFKGHDTCSIKLINVYIRVIEEKYDINIDTHNLYKCEIFKIMKIYKYLMQENNISNTLPNELSPEETKDYASFCNKLYVEVRENIRSCFPNKFELSRFLDYIYSLAYAYLKREEESSEELLDEEKEFIDMIENGADLCKDFFNNIDNALIVIENVYDNILEYGFNYDLRRTITTPKAVECLERLDPYYNDKPNFEIMINDITLNEKLKLILLYIKNSWNLSNAKIEDILTNNNLSFYRELYTLGLDARFPEFYKKMMINIIVTEVYEYLCYTGENIEIKNEIEKLDNSLDNLVSFFISNSSILLDLFYEYNMQSNLENEKVLIHNYQNKNIKKISNLNEFFIYKYIGIISGHVKELKSVDYINNLMEEIVNSNRICIGSEEDTKIFINTICLFVYERILAYKLDDEDFSEIIKFIENSKNLVDDLLNNPELLNKIITILVYFCKDDNSYTEEGKIRKKIEDEGKIKILKKLNLFGEMQ